MKSIRTKILVVVISGLLILSLTIGGVVLYATHQILYRNADTIMRFESENEATKINDMLGDMEKSIQIVSEAAVEQLDSADSLLDLDYQQAYTRDMELLFNNAARNTEGMIAYYFRYNPDLRLPDVGFFYGLTTQTNELQKLPVTDLSGNRDHIRWWHEPTTAQKAVWIAPYYHSNSDFLMVSYVAPIYKDGQLIGVAGMDIQLSYLLNAVKEISPYENGYAYLLSRTGEELYHPYNNLRSDGSDQDIATSSAPLDNGMTLVVCAYYNDIQSQGNRMVTSMVLMSLGVVVCFILLTIVITKKIIGPLRRLAVVATSMGNRKELSEIDCNLKDEVGVLYQVLNDANRRLYENMTNVQAQAYRDSLTGLKNSAAYTEAVAELEKRIVGEHPKFAVVVFDINNLKIVNDTYGHEYGNELLVRVTKLIAGAFHRSLAYRIGGDEFVVILENDDYEEYQSLIARFDELCENEYLMIEDVKIPVSVARGVAIYDPEIDSNYENVFHRADGLMYRHKREQKGF